MNYDLAKEMENAGWKFKEIAVDTYIGVNKPDGGMLAPTLSELIEACGEKFSGLLKIQGESRFKCVAPGDIFSIEAETPEEAVARYWLYLNTK